MSGTRTDGNGSRWILLMLFALTLAACSGDDAPAEVKENARTVTVAQIQLHQFLDITAATGLLVPREEAAVAAEQSGYRVVQVFVEEGAIVRAGQPLARLDDVLLRTRVTQFRASAEQAQSEANRVKDLDGTGILSDEEIAQRRSNAIVAQAQLADIRVQAEHMVIRAPVSGLVLERNVRPGAVSGGSEPMFRIARDRLMELDAEVAEDALSAIRIGSSATVTLPSGEVFAGEVRLVGPRIDPHTKLGRVRIRLPVNTSLRAGGFGSARFHRQARPLPSVPEKAVQYEASGPLVTVIDSGNRSKRMAVRTGARADGYVELIDGPAVNTRVTLGGGAFLLDGDLVTPIPSSAPAPASSTSALPGS